MRKGVRYLAGLGRSSTDVLSDEVARLRAIKDDILRLQESQSPRNYEVGRWLKEADDLISEVDRFKGSRIHGLRYLKDFPSWATDMLERVHQLNIIGIGLKQKLDEDSLRGDGLKQKEMLGEEPLRTSDGVIPNPQIVGREETLNEVLGHLRNSDVKIVGIHGMPGIGKTALLQKIYHKLNGGSNPGGSNRSTVLVVYAVVSKELNIGSLQRKIAEGLGVTLAKDEPNTDAPPLQTQHARTLIRELWCIRSVLLLDDVWEGLDWNKIGIPSPDVGSPCQIVFTTPLRQVCSDMKVSADNIVSIGNLSETQSWELFCRKVNKPVDDHSIVAAREVISRCGGLPHAVITLSMAANRERDKLAKKLKHSPHKIDDMKDKVISLLKCISDKLEEKARQMEERAVEMRQCLLYCSLFPENQDICIDRLVDYWMGEGFIDAKCHLNPSAARDEGRKIVRTLMDECFLLSNASYANEQYSWEVKVHDMFRGMAMWLTDGGNNSEQSTLFLTSTRLKNSTDRRWQEAARISSKDGGPKSNVFRCAQALGVLDLSGTKIETLQAEIGCMGELQYLNLSHTNIRSLPRELNKLQKLRQLRLRGTHRLSSIPKNCILPKPILQIFDLFDSGYFWSPSTGILFPERQIDLSDLTTLYFLKETGLTMTDLFSLERSCSFPELSKSTAFLKLKDMEGLSNDHLSSVFTTMENLQELSISMGNNSADTVTNLEIGATQLPKLQVLDMRNLTSLSSIDLVGVGTGRSFLRNLRHLHISNCPGLTHVTWVHQLPSLVEIALWDCQGVEEVVGNHCFSLPTNLKKIYLFGLPNLTRIAGRPLISSPSLEIVSVIECPLLKRLSFDTKTATSIKEIKGEREWWDGLRWDANDANRAVLQTRFKVASRR